MLVIRYADDGQLGPASGQLVTVEPLDEHGLSRMSEVLPVVLAEAFVSERRRRTADSGIAQSGEPAMSR